LCTLWLSIEITFFIVFHVHLVAYYFLHFNLDVLMYIISSLDT
jgi:hypothetical protein